MCVCVNVLPFFLTLVLRAVYLCTIPLQEQSAWSLLRCLQGHRKWSTSLRSAKRDAQTRAPTSHRRGSCPEGQPRLPDSQHIRSGCIASLENGMYVWAAFTLCLLYLSLFSLCVYMWYGIVHNEYNYLAHSVVVHHYGYDSDWISPFQSFHFFLIFLCVWRMPYIKT